MLWRPHKEKGAKILASRQIGAKMRYQFLPFLVLLWPFAIANEYIALIRYVSRDGYVLFVPIQWVLQYNPIDFDESLAFIRYSYCNIKIALTKEGTLMLTLLHELYTVVKCFKIAQI